MHLQTSGQMIVAAWFPTGHSTRSRSLRQAGNCLILPMLPIGASTVNSAGQQRWQHDHEQPSRRRKSTTSWLFRSTIWTSYSLNSWHGDYVGERPWNSRFHPMWAVHIVKLPKMNQKSPSASLNSIGNLLQGAYVGSKWAFLAFFLHKRAQ